MTKYCAHCQKPITNNNKTYCSRACSGAAYDLMKSDRQSDRQTWADGRAWAVELATLDAEMATEERITTWVHEASTVLAERLAAIFAAHPGAYEVAVGNSDLTIEHKSDGTYETRYYLMEGEWGGRDHDTLQKACADVSEFAANYGHGDPKTVQVDGYVPYAVSGA